MTHALLWHIIRVVTDCLLIPWNSLAVYGSVRLARWRPRDASFLAGIFAASSWLRYKSEALTLLSVAIFLFAMWLGRGGGRWLRRKLSAARSSLTAVGEAAFRRDVEATG